MIDHNRIQSGFDVEILLGSEYFLTIFHGAYDSGEIQSQMDLGNGVMLQINKPTSCQILANSNDADIEITFPIELLVGGSSPIPHNATLGLFVVITTENIEFEYQYLDETTRNTITIFETTSGNPGILEEVENTLRDEISSEIELDLLSENVVELSTRKINGTDGYQTAYGLYANLGLRTIRALPGVSFDIDQFVPRGSLDLTISFLPANRSFAIGFSNETFQRFENDAWNDLAEEKSNGSYHFPVRDGDEKVGHFTALTVSLKSGFIKLEIKMRIYIDNWPDADVTAVFHYTPRVQNGILTIDMELHDFDADTGLLGDFLGFLCGTLLFGIVGFILGGPAGAGLLASIGGVGGVITVEITEEVMEGKFDDQVEEESRSVGFDNAFTTFPTRTRLFADRTDPFYDRWFVLVNYFDEIKVDSKGMSLAGHALIDTENETTDVTIIDKERGDGADSWNGLLSLTYRTSRSGDVILPILEVLERIHNRELARVDLNATHIHRYRGVVADIQFDSGMDLRVGETIVLQNKSVIFVHQFQLIQPRKLHAKYNKIPNPYYRARADDTIDNNFEELPTFDV